MPPDSPLALSASARTRCLYSPVKMRRFALATTSGSGCPAMTSAASLRSALVPSMADRTGKSVFVLFFMLNFLPALHSN